MFYLETFENMTKIIIMNLILLYRRGRSTCLNTSTLCHQIQSRHVFSPLKIKQVHIPSLLNILILRGMSCAGGWRQSAE